MTTPNNIYFNRVDYILQQADRYGMQCLVFPLFTGYNCGDDGYGGQIAAASNADLTSFANYLAARYGSQGNIIWVMGGDSDPVACGFSGKISTFATALHPADPGHLITEHNARNSEAVTPWLPTSVPSWLTLNATYTDRYTYALSAAAYSRSPTKPFFHIEAYYEHDSHNLSKQDIRKQSYWAVLSGAAGYMFGACPLWGLGSPDSSTTCVGAPGTWQAEMDDTGSANMTKFANLFSSRAWQTLVPDFSHTFVTAGYGTLGTVNYVTTSKTADGTLAISYLPVNATITVDMTKLAGTTNASWYDPTNGSYTTVSGSPFSNTGSRTFNHSGSNSAGDSDWVLVLESAGSPAPTPNAPNNLKIHSATIEQDNPKPVEPIRGKSSFFALIAAVALNASANTPTSQALKPFTLQWDAKPAAQGVLYCNTNQEMSADFYNCIADVYVPSPINYTSSVAALPDGIGAKIRISGEQP